ncbi:hypothetical protein KAH81_02285 [bacterium]|nr:hypothetical protein [bacterium]
MTKWVVEVVARRCPELVEGRARKSCAHGESRSASSKTTVGSADRVSPRSRLEELEREQGNLAGAVFKLLKELESPALLEKKPTGIYTGTRKNSRKNEFFACISK